MGDDEPFYVQGEKYNDKTTIGQWLKYLLTELEYHDTMVRLCLNNCTRIALEAMHIADATNSYTCAETNPGEYRKIRGCITTEPAGDRTVSAS